MELLTDLNRDGLTIVLVTHDERVASYAARELLIRDGVLASDRKQAPRPGTASQAREASHVVG
jgi:putative ABC transport system ATP-binding protein